MCVERDETDKDNGRVTDFRSATSVLPHNQSLFLLAGKSVHTYRRLAVCWEKCAFNLLFITLQVNR